MVRFIAAVLIGVVALPFLLVGCVIGPPLLILLILGNEVVYFSTGFWLIRPKFFFPSDDR